MSKNKELSPALPFSVITKVRITDVNYGGHLGYKETIGHFHNARVLFLKKNGFKELDIEGKGMILLNAHVHFSE